MSFRPSRDSGSSSRVVLVHLHQMRQALDKIEAELRAGKDLPNWVTQYIAKASTSLGMAVSYLQRKKL